MSDDRDRWNDRYEQADFDPDDDPVPALERRISTLPDGRALDVATGTGRNALFLAEHGYDVDAVDISDAALERARDRAAERGVDANWIRADLADFDPGRERYDVIVVSFFAALEHLPALKDALAPGGVLIYEHHLRSSDPVAGPSTDRYRYRSNDLLRACLDLTILSYEERRRPVDDGGDEDGSEDDDGTIAVATLVARRSSGGTQSYPLVSDVGGDDA
ncbi:bifunctional 2-polyprenyl-6-hydroxyphenol methylase/3-demethylubiquinol 3-O-methyltransferase UbiG [Natrinema versiforme]|uniref:Class I SAM-dependent methyltransferase n=1 Tax=Natrinema versiforme TaxID=88724 RepID=A0A4P8WIJ3_9EURY|nr:class I SAM-dependent methyltransferase [Natrinema versiforme]QCS43269.1 class I SAM-dependent methyltransferase [Natrinema versiforme]